MLPLQLHIHVATNFPAEAPHDLYYRLNFFLALKHLWRALRWTYHHQKYRIAMQCIEVEMFEQSDVEDPGISDAYEVKVVRWETGRVKSKVQ